MTLPPDSRTALLHLNALQNLALKMTEPPGFNPDLVARVQGELSRRGVPLAGIERPFTLQARRPVPGDQRGDLGAGTGAVERRRLCRGREASRARNAERRMERIRGYIGGWLASFKANPDPRVRDMGTVLHLILCEEMASLNQLIKRAM